jgi:hypothetical protein
LRYLDADELDDEGVEFDGMDVHGSAGDKLGDVDGFIVDAQSGRPYYVVVDNDGWFTTKHFLVPVGHIRLDESRNVLVADLTRERISRFPGFDKDEFEKMSVEDIRRFNDQTCQASSVTALSYSTTEPLTSAWDRPQFAYPTWWASHPALPDRMGANAVTTGAEVGARSPSLPERGSREAERIMARSDEHRGPEDEGRVPASDPSPHFAGRAQPGDVIGFETGGERTHVGETAEDEDKRRRDAEKAAPKEKP